MPRDLDALSRMFLTALGLPCVAVSCSTAPTIVPRPDPVVTTPLDASCVEPGEVCVYTSKTCGENASGLGPDIRTATYKGAPWAPQPDAAGLARLRFNAERTKAIRAEAFPGQDPYSYCCYAGCPAYEEVAPDSVPPREGPIVPLCVIPPPRVDLPSQSEPRCPGAIVFDGERRLFHSWSQERCCYQATPFLETGDKGRPLLEAGERTSVEAADAAGVVPWPLSSAHSDAERALQAAAWTRDAFAEHASVAAFAKVALELLAFGAPASLVRGVHEAALDELRHAELCARVAAAYGATVRPGAHPRAAHILPITDLETFVRETIEQGCIGEAAAALEARRAADACPDQGVAVVHRVIAEDEARHAALAWQIVSWAAEVGGEPVFKAIRECLEELAERCSTPELVTLVAIPVGEALIDHVRPAAQAPLCE